MQRPYRAGKQENGVGTKLESTTRVLWCNPVAYHTVTVKVGVQIPQFPPEQGCMPRSDRKERQFFVDLFIGVQQIATLPSSLCMV